MRSRRSSVPVIAIALVTVVAMSILSSVLAEQSGPTTRASDGVSEQRDRDAALHEYVEAARAELSRGKVEVINEVMQLTPDESATFWPIYAEYEEELFALGDRRIALMRQFATAQHAGGIDKCTATQIADGWFDFERSRLELYRKYYDRIERDFSPVQAIRFVQIEHRFATVVDLMLASEMPIAGGKPVTAAATEGPSPAPRAP